MPKEPNKLLRVAVPAVLFLLAALVAVAVFKNTGKKPPAATPPTTTAPTVTPTGTTPESAPGTTPPAPTDAGPANPANPATVPGPDPANPTAPTVQPSATPGSTETPVPGTGYRARRFLGDPLASTFAPLGGLGTAQPYALQLEFSPLGAGLKSVRLANHYTDLTKTQNIAVQHEYSLPLYNPDGTPNLGPSGPLTANLVPFSAGWIEINGQVVALSTSEADPIWRQTGEKAAGSFEALIENAEGAEIARVTRVFSLTPGSHVVTLRQRVANTSGTPMKVRFHQFGPVDLDQEQGSYGGDKRRVRFGYLTSPSSDPSRQAVVADNFVMQRQTALGKPIAAPNMADAMGYQVFVYPESSPLWPNEKSTGEQFELVWAGVTNRYFGAALHSLVDPAVRTPTKAFQSVQTVDRLVLSRVDSKGVGPSYLTLRTSSPVLDVAPGTEANLDAGIFAGPLSRPEIREDPLAHAAGLDGLVVFNFGGLCGPCTFPVVTSLLFWLLHFLHDTIFHDWSLAIIFLVVIVRSCLHPVTRWSQVRMQRFGKQMQAMGPKQKKIQEKFKDNPKEMQGEMAKLWREEGVSPTGMLGCIPMFLVMPVWIALYAVLYFAVEFRHAPAFFGVFQTITGGKWHFMADLSEADHAFPFGKTLHIPLLSSMLGPISALNILPFILGAVFFVHQKYLSPPQTAPQTPEQEMQMKMVKWMSVFMFPLFMYNAPSGLALYFIANSSLAIVENKWIRRHIDKHDLLNIEKMKGKRKGGGFIGRLMEAAEQRKQMLEQVQKNRGQAKGQQPWKRK
jgi:YidC/Oxa1 family membrane protein insertase